MDSVDSKTDNKVKPKKAKLKILFLIITVTVLGLTVYCRLSNKTISEVISNKNVSEADFFDYCLTVKNLEYKARQKYPDKQKVLDEWNNRIADLEAELPKIDQSLYPYYYKERTDEISLLKKNIETFNKYGYTLEDRRIIVDAIDPPYHCFEVQESRADKLARAFAFAGIDISCLEYNGDYKAFKKDVHNLYTKLDNKGVFDKIQIDDDDDHAIGCYGTF